MAGLIEEITFVAYKITGACWRILKEPDNTTVNLIYSDDTLITPYQVQIADDLDQLFRDYKSGNLTFPVKDVHIRMDRSIEQHNLSAQVDALDLDWLDQNFNNLVAFCKVVGIVRLVLRFFVAAKITLANVQTIFIYYLQEKKSTRAQIEVAVDWLEANNHITTAQKTAFWANVDAALGI